MNSLHMLLSGMVIFFLTANSDALEINIKSPYLPPGVAELPPTPGSLAGGKVTRTRIAEMSIVDKAYYEEKLREFTEAVTGPKASRLCKNISVFCRVNASDEYIGFLSKYPKEVTRDVASVGKMKVSLADLKNSGFAKFRRLGYVAEGIGANPPWSSVARLFKARDEDLALLSEWDFVSDEGGIEQSEEFLNSKIGRFDASAMRSISSAGRSLWHLNWVDGTKQIQLYYFCPSENCISQTQFIALANSIYSRK